MYINVSYYYFGSINSAIHFKNGNEPGTVDLLTDYGELIATVSNINELQEVLKNLDNDVYDRKV